MSSLLGGQGEGTRDEDVMISQQVLTCLLARQFLVSNGPSLRGRMGMA
jgi:hypothetical protein